jgi:hypothetical protein
MLRFDDSLIKFRLLSTHHLMVYGECSVAAEEDFGVQNSVA